MMNIKILILILIYPAICFLSLPFCISAESPEGNSEIEIPYYIKKPIVNRPEVIHEIEIEPISIGEHSDPIMWWRPEDEDKFWLFPYDGYFHPFYKKQEKIALLSNPRVTMNDAGDCIIVWHQIGGSFSRVYKSEYRDGEWVHPSGMEDYINPDGGNAYFPNVALADNGEALIVWYQFNQEGSRKIYKSEYREGIWSHPNSLENHINQYDTGRDFPFKAPEIVMDKAGNAVVFWYESVSEQQLYRSEYRNGVWTHPLSSQDRVGKLLYDHGSQPCYKAAMDDNGNTFIVWQDGEEYRGGYLLKEYKTDARNKRFLFGHSDNSSPDYCPDIVMDVYGNAVIVWKQSGSYLNPIYKGEYRDNLWKLPSGVNDYISPEGANFTITSNNNGIVRIVWVEWDARLIKKKKIVSTEFINNQWTQPQTVAIYHYRYDDDIEPQAALDAKGSGLVIWTEQIGAEYKQFEDDNDDAERACRIMISKKGGTVWQQPYSLVDNIRIINKRPLRSWQCSYQISPRLVMNSKGDSILVWQETNGLSKFNINFKTDINN